MEETRQKRKELFQPLFQALKDYLSITQVDYLKEHDIALFGAPSEVFDKYYLEVIDAFIRFISNHQNRAWISEIRDRSPVDLFLSCEGSYEFDIDFLRYTGDLFNAFKDMQDKIDESCKLSELRELLEKDAEELKKNLKRFSPSTKEEKEYFDLAGEYLKLIWRRIETELPSFGEAGEEQIAKYAKLKHEIYLYNEPIKVVLDYKGPFHFDIKEVNNI